MKDDIEGSVFRDENVTLAGTTRFDFFDFQGEWNTVACIGNCADEVEYILWSHFNYTRTADGVETSFHLPKTPGVLRERKGEQTLVIMWVDEGFRTAAIGDADGRWAAIIDRGAGSADRTRAAREVLDFNGWDVSQLRDVK